MGMVEYQKSAFDAAEQEIGDGAPIYMVNLIRYRAEAQYLNDDASEPSSGSGKEVYFQRYVPAFARVAEGEDYSVFWVGNIRGLLVAAPGEHWDDIVIVKYASIQTLRRILESPDYETQAAPHRRAALEDWRFIVTTKVDLPG